MLGISEQERREGHAFARGFGKRMRSQSVPASYLILARDGKVLLSQRFNTGYRDGDYSLVAGHVDKGETFTQCLIREAEEEAGILLRPEDLEFVHLMSRKSDKGDSERVDVFFLAMRWEGEVQNMEPDKCGDLEWFDFSHLPENTIPYVRKVLECVESDIFYSEYGW